MGKRVILSALAAAALFTCLWVGGAGATGVGTMTCTGAAGVAKNGDYEIIPGTSVLQCTISGAVSGSGAVTILVKHSDSPTTSSYPISGGNEQVPGTYTDANTITFTYDATDVNSCATATVSYGDPSGAVGQGSSLMYVASNGSDAISCDSSQTPPPPPPPNKPTLDPGGQDGVINDPASTAYTLTYGDWGISKTVDSTKANIATGSSAPFNYTVTVTHDSGTASDWTVNGTIIATNPNADDITGATANVADVNCTTDSSTQTIPANNGTATWDYSCAYSTTPPDSIDMSVSWPDQGWGLGAGSAPATENLDWNSATVTRADSTASVYDNGLLGTVDATTDGGSTVFTYQRSYDGVGGTCTDYPNTATLMQDDSQIGQDSKTVTVCDGNDVGIGAGSSPSYTRTYSWTVSKSVDKTLVEKSGGGTGAFTYTVNVNHDAGTDSAWNVSGTITVTNPNDWETVPVTVSDSISNGGTCSVTGGDSNGNTVTLAESGSATLNYSCTYGSAPSPASYTDTATVTWDATAASTPDNSASGTAAGAFGDPTTVVNGTTTLTDSLNHSLNQTIGLGDTPWSTTYTLNLAVPASNCAYYTNVASLSTGGSDSKTVETCGPSATGALSMGYWSNKNGQSQITGAGTLPSSTTCSLTSYLRGFAPFQDLSQTATCSQVNTYVQSIIKSANASGAAMNAMLKGQMLAVALDAKLISGVGATVVDLTNVNGENVSGAFGGATSMSINGMLAYAGSRSNLGGTTWYGQVKATQALAKDAFDAICNQQVYAP